MSKRPEWNVLSDDAIQALTNLKEGQVLALRMRVTNNTDENLPKVQIEFAEKIKSGNAVKTAATMFNAVDSRFTSGAVRVWEGADQSIAEQMFGELDESGQTEILTVMNSLNGEDFRIQVTEDVESNLTEKEHPYAENYLKRAGKDGEYFYAENGERVIVRRRLVQVESGTNPVHTYISGKFAPASKGTLESVSKSNIASDILAGA